MRHAPRLRSTLAALALLALAAGCMTMDPSIYQGSGATPRTSARETPARSPAAAARTAPAGRAIDNVPPRGDPFWGMPKQGDILGKAPDNVAIIVEKLDAATVTSTDLGLDFRARRGDVTVEGGSSLAARNGLGIRVASSSLAARLGASTGRVRSTNRQQMFIVVKSGQEGALAMGSDVYVPRLGIWTPSGYVVLVQHDFVGRQLAVRPTILGGGRVAVELWPRFSTRRGRVIEVTQLATKVVVRDGQSIVLGGLTTANSEVAAVLFGAGAASRTGSTTLLLTVQVGGLDMDFPKGRW